MNYILFDDSSRNSLLPLTLTRPVADIRIGILTVREKWEKLLQAQTSSLTQDYLSGKFPLFHEDTSVLINGSVLPTVELADAVAGLKPGESLAAGKVLLAVYAENKDLNSVLENALQLPGKKSFESRFNKITFPWDIFSRNGEAVIADFQMLTKGKTSEQPDASNTILGNGMFFMEQGAKVRASVFNTDNGPIYIGKDAEVMEGSRIRGPFALCTGAVVKMGAKIYGPTTVGPFSKAGGELNNVVIMGYSNKAHDGFLGNSVIGEWCNLGADTNSSNLKNTYEEVKVWSYENRRFVKTGLQFCGLIMGDHSKCGINTMFNTGTVVGVSANIYGPGFQRNFIKSFSWGGTQGFTTYNLDKALKVAGIVYGRRNKTLTPDDENILKHIYQLSLESNI